MSPDHQTTTQVGGRCYARLEFTYRVKIINPSKKSDVMVRELHHFHSKFTSLVNLHAKLVEEFNDSVPDSGVGYYEGQRYCKMVIATQEDINAMYRKYPSGDITLWCDGKSEDNGKGKRKRETSKYNEREIEVDEIYRELEAKHSEKFEVPKLRLWARMISSNLHDSIDDPPKIPVFGGSKPKRPRQDLSNALSGAAIALTQALNHKKGTDSDEQSTSISTTTTMQMQVDLRMKNLEQLKFIKQLYDDRVLTEAEFTEQKENVLSAIRKL